MSKTKWKKKMMIVVVAAVVMVAAIVTVTAMRGKEQRAFVDVFALQKGAIAVTVPANGVLEEVEKQTIYTETNVKVVSVEVKEGDFVKAGQVLATLDSEDLGNQLEIKKKMLGMEKIELAKLEGDQEEAVAEHRRRIERSFSLVEEAKASLERSKELYDHGAIPQQAYRDEERAYEDALRDYEEIKEKRVSAEFDIQRMQKKIAITELEIREIQEKMGKQQNKIISHIDGVVTAVHLEAGSIANPANPSFVISNTKDLRIEIKVSEYDIAKVALGQEVEIQTDAVADKTFRGVVEKIAPVARRESTGQTTETVIAVTIKVEETDDLLKPGFTVKTKIINQQQEDVLLVPFDTIMTEANGAKTVFVVEEDILHRVEIQTGIESDFEIEIIEGLEVDQKIVLNPSMDLQEGMKVLVNERK
ncbi:efflux transporter, RND family, MFP subunit [Clostridium aceticum]|uniref:Efflux transporter, RND family, MFP subunit n=1 Tax=Clostridium aceticum TaxID=84022 RepID=A0A0D8I9I7_9CLOT|nr:efflux RND transporter periplasmic adaptor subunit [Clostridium aceticum]AKL93851.1 efflux transporter, RND family, MFP subunit [Clostridium aceticum]KJF25876.1 hypothetical protein TZ02_16950 [Clostridium aceticum]